MRRTIWKYEIGVEDVQYIPMPKGAQILAVQAQQQLPCLWALVDPEKKHETETRIIETFGTGHEIDDAPPVMRNYVGTYQLHGGALVWHIFERTN
jgi:hypothetical protein